MGFFSELKEDLSQAVNELLPDEGNADTPAIPNDAEGLGELLERMDADNLLGDTLEELPIENREEPTIEKGSYFASVVEQKETPAKETALPKDVKAEETKKPEEPAAEKVTSVSASQNKVPDEVPEEKTKITTESYETPNSGESDSKSDKKEEAMEGLQENKEETVKVESEKIENEKPVEEAVEKIDTGDENNEDNGGFKMDSQLANKSAVDETAVITAGMTIQGDIISEGSMEVIGSIIGNIDILGKLNITGAVQGNSKAAEIYCENAKITGEIASEGSVKIGQSTVIIGNISANSAVIAGAVKGDIDVHGPVVLDTSAIVMGNIKSKSVQINNGAVIEGMCSQCYADISPSSFFEDFKAMTKKGNK